MAKELQSITLGAVGFYGLNTELSPVELPPQFATTANNCVIDKYGRLGSRKGFNTQTSVTTGLGSNPVKRIFEWTSSGSSILFAVGNNKIFRVDTTTTTNDTLTEMSLPIGYTITGDDWDFCDFNGEAFFFQAGHEPLLCNATLNGTDDLDTLDNQSGDTTPAAPEGNIILAANGRLWSAGVTSDPNTVYWSDTLIGDSWEITGGSAAGSINITLAWPDGYDEIVGMAFHNNRLIIFGSNNIVIYNGADDPSTMALEDTISGTGCFARDSIQHTGDDIVFLSPTGVRLLSRTIQESSLPLGEVTSNVRKSIIDDINTETVGINSVFSYEENFYLLILEGQNYVYCVDFKTRLEDGSRKVTVWPGVLFNCACRADDGTLYVGGTPGVGTYSGYQDDGAAYRYQYYGPALTFGAPDRLKILKSIRPIMIGSSTSDVTISWGYGYSDTYSTQVLALTGSAPTEYNIGEYNIGEYSSSTGVTDKNVKATGSGTEVKLGVAVDINGFEFSLQQMSVKAIIGRLI